MHFTGVKILNSFSV